MPSLRDIDKAGQDLRPWCFRCARGGHVDAIIWELFVRRGWPIDLPAATQHFRCESCGESDQVLVVPATRPDTGPTDSKRLVVAWFHSMRSQAKKKR